MTMGRTTALLLSMLVAAGATGAAPDPSAARPAPSDPFEGRSTIEIPLRVRSTGLLPVPLVLPPGEGGGHAGGAAAGDCPPTIATHTDANFEGGAFTVQAGFAQQEIAACSYVLPAGAFPIILERGEMIFATSGSLVTTTTQWTFLVWEGLPSTGNLVAQFSSDGTILPHIVLPPGTNGVNVMVFVDPGDPEQIVIQNNGSNTFSIGYRIDVHNNQTQNPCFVGPPAASNAFPTTDTSGLQNATNNWLYGVNCGSLGCPANGGWARFSQLNVLCRPSGDWVMRATWRSINCTPLVGACCLPTGLCEIRTQASCTASGGTYQGDNVQCGQVSCPPASGACCFGFECQPGVTQDGCLGAGGVWQGAASTCGASTCNEGGACCFPQSGGCLDLTASACQTAGGLFVPGQVCASYVCFPSGSCCFPDGSCQDNSGAGMTPDACTALGGTFQGHGTACGTTTCPIAPGACCFEATGGCLVLALANCQVAGGVFGGGGTTCPDGCLPDCPFDLDESGDIGFGDVLIILGTWGPCAGCPEDLDGDGEVGFGDALLLLSNWGPC